MAVQPSKPPTNGELHARRILDFPGVRNAAAVVLVEHRGRWTLYLRLATPGRRIPIATMTTRLASTPAAMAVARTYGLPLELEDQEEDW